MQDIYAFDVGDYGKLGLLRHLMAYHLTLAVIWWKTELGSSGNDGKHLTYLRSMAYRQCDPDLWDAMHDFVSDESRSIASLQSLFPEGTLFFADVIPPSVSGRLKWFDQALSWSKSADVVFCDPDNGIDFESSTRSQRHVSVSELQQLYRAGHSVVAYHHLNRSGPHSDQIRRGARLLADAVTAGQR